MITIYSDGSSSGRKDGPGGWGFVIVRDGQIVLAGYGGDPSTTNNLMELRGAWEGLEAVVRKNLRHPGEPVVLVSDSEYVLGFAKGALRAKRNLVETGRVRAAALALAATTRWVRGHSLKQGEEWDLAHIDVLMNHRVDTLAKLGKQKTEAALTNKNPADMEAV